MKHNEAKKSRISFLLSRETTWWSIIKLDELRLILIPTMKLPERYIQTALCRFPVASYLSGYMSPEFRSRALLCRQDSLPKSYKSPRHCHLFQQQEKKLMGKSLTGWAAPAQALRQENPRQQFRDMRSSTPPNFDSRNGFHIFFPCRTIYQFHR